jgi:hypothetical protein
MNTLADVKYDRGKNAISIVEKEVENMYKMLDYILDRYNELSDKHDEALSHDEDLSDEDMAKMKLLGHLIELYTA